MGCDFYDLYGTMLLVEAVVLFCWNPFAGYIADHYNPFKSLFAAIIVASAAAGVLYSGM